MPQWLLPLMALLAFSAGAAWINSSSDHAIPQQYVSAHQTPNIPAKQQPESAGDTKISGNSRRQESLPLPIIVPPSQTSYAQTKPNTQTNDGDDESTEWWTILGHRLKITDTILAAFTALLFFAAIWQGYQLKLTVGHTRESVELSRDSFIIENRAYVTPVAIIPDKIINVDTGRVAEWRFTPQWRNSGQTPARRVRHLTNAILFDMAGMPLDFDFPDNERNGPDRTVGRVIGPAFTVGGPEFQIDASIFRDIMRRHRFFVWGWIEYRDVFSNTPIRRAEWCSELEVMGDITAPTADAAVVFRLTSIDRFNGTDEDCYRKPGEEAPLRSLEQMMPASAGPRLQSVGAFIYTYPAVPPRSEEGAHDTITFMMRPLEIWGWRPFDG